MQGLLLGASFYGVASTQVLIGYLSDKYGHCKLQMLVGALVLSLANILSPFVIIYLGNYYFFALRILMGMAMVMYHKLLIASISISVFQLTFRNYAADLYVIA